MFQKNIFIIIIIIIIKRVELGLPNYVTKFDLKRVTGIDLAKFDLANFKSDVNDLDIDKLKTVPVDLSKLSSAVKMMF